MSTSSGVTSRPSALDLRTDVEREVAAATARERRDA